MISDANHGSGQSKTDMDCMYVSTVGGVQVVKFSLNSFMTLGLMGKFVQGRYCKSVVRFNFLLLINISCSFLRAIIQPGFWTVSEQGDREIREGRRSSHIVLLSAETHKPAVTGY